MWTKGLGSLRATIEDGVKEFSREAFADGVNVVKDGRRIVKNTAEKVDVAGVRQLAGRAVSGALQRSSSRTGLSNGQPETGSANGGTERGSPQPHDQLAALNRPELVRGLSEHRARPDAEFDDVPLLSPPASQASAPVGWAPNQNHERPVSHTGSPAQVLQGAPDCEGLDSQERRHLEDADPRPSLPQAAAQQMQQPSASKAPADTADGIDQLEERRLAEEAGAEGLQPAEQAISAPADLQALQAELAAVAAERDALARLLKEEQTRAEAAEGRVAGLAGVLQQRLGNLAAEVEARGNALEKLRDENDTLTNDYNAVKARLAAADAAAAQARAAAEAATTDAAKRITEVQAEAAAAAARARASEEQAAVAVQNVPEHEALQARCGAALGEAAAAGERAAAAEARAEAAERAAKEAQAARQAAEAARRETELQAQAAAVAAEEERAGRREADGTAAALRAEAERRARVFQAAVRAAVAKVQHELEAERDAVSARLVEAEAALTGARLEAAAARREAESAGEEAARRTEDAHLAGAAAASAEEATETARSRERAATSRAAEAETQLAAAKLEAKEVRSELAAALARAGAAEAAVQASQASAAQLMAKAKEASSRLEMEAARWQARAEAAEEAAHEAAREADVRFRAATALHPHTSASDAGPRQELSALHARVEELQRELAEARRRSGARPAFEFALPSRADVLASLGIDGRVLGGEAATLQPPDLEQGAPKKDPPRRGVGRLVASGRAVAAATRGHISARTWLVIAYLAALHLAVMLSFTQRRDACLDRSLPGGLTAP